ncbi:MAG TPA: glutathione S-transferase family protein [Burkholderiales bacterium]|jgi:glutathione S-transferase|nr:glutathione S-transferase family protein [Burkholderiales bacterium]
MAITFYYGSGSPYAWRVWLALEAKGLSYDQKVISFSEGDHKKPGYLALNPRHKVPVIVDGDFPLYESAAIMEYLDEQYPSGMKLFPGDARQRALVRRLIREADDYFAGAAEPIQNAIFFTKRENWDAGAITAGREKLAREAAKWETVLAGDYLAGDALSAADFTLYPMVALCLRMDVRKPDLDVAAVFGPKTRVWMGRMQALPYLEKTIPPHWKK